MHKRDYARFLRGLKGRLHFAAHSHHLWPDATRAAALECWDHAAAEADGKWERVFARTVPEAQGHVARILGLSRPGQVAFAPNTHELVCRLLSCLDWSRPVRVLTSDGEFHSFARQLARLEETGRVRALRVPTEPFATFERRLAREAARWKPDLVYVSQVFFDSGYALRDLPALVRRVPRRSLIAVDGYHAFCAVPTRLAAVEKRVFYLAGGYKYAQAGEGACFMAVPPGCSLRPVDTGWLADYAALERPRGGRVSYGPGGWRFWGATFDPSGLYRFNAAMRWMKERGLTVPRLHAHVLALQERFLRGIGEPLREKLLTPADSPLRGHFLTFRVPDASAAARRLARRGVLVDARGDRLRFGFGVYHDERDVDALCRRLR